MTAVVIAAGLLNHAAAQERDKTPPSSQRQEIRLYEDIYLHPLPEQIVFGNSALKLEVDRKSGRWVSLTAEGVPGSLIQPASRVVDFRIDDVWMIERHGADFLRHEVSIDKSRNGVSLRLIFGVAPLGNDGGSKDQSSGGATVAGNGDAASGVAYEFELICSYTLFPREGRLDRAARLRRNPTGRASASDARRMDGFLFQLPGATIAETSACVVDVPGPFFPKTFVAPATQYDALKNSSIQFHSAPDAGFGILAVSNRQRRATLASWMDTSGEVSYRPAIEGDGKLITLSHTNHRAYRMPEGFAVDSDVQRIVVTKDLPDALHEYRRMLARTMPLASNTPQWAREMVILEVFPEYFSDGFKGLTKKLPFYKGVGFNTVYLMPHWVGGYSPIDLYRVDSSLGTSDDLKEAVRAAHALGMKVLFDMVIHGFNEKSPVIAQRPELFVRDENGKLARHRTWKSVSTDWASQAYQQYMVDLALYDLKTYDIDGYRVDAASYKGAGWDATVSYPAYRSGSAAPELMTRMLRAMQEKKPETVLLNEVFGPVFYSVSNLSHDNQTEAPQLLLEKMEKGEYTAAQYKEHIANVLDALPEGSNRVYYTRNHDTSWFYHFNGYTPRFMAMEAIHAFFGIPEVFAGDPKHGPDPEDNPAVYDYYLKLFAARKTFPELVCGDVLLREVKCDNPSVFAGVRREGNQSSLVIISLSGDVEAATVTVRLPELTDTARREASGKMLDVITGEEVSAARDGSGAINLKLKPFQVLIGRL